MIFLLYLILHIFLANRGILLSSAAVYLLAMIFAKTGRKIISFVFCLFLLLFLLTHIGAAYTAIENGLGTVQEVSSQLSAEMGEKLKNELESGEGDFADRFGGAIRALFTGEWKHTESAEPANGQTTGTQQSSATQPSEEIVLWGGEFFLWRELKNLFGFPF